MKHMKNSPQQNKPRKQAASRHQTNSKQGHRNAPLRRTNRNGFGCSLAFALVLAGLGLVVAIGGPRLLAFVDQTGAATLPLEDHTSPAALAERRNAEMAQLQGYGWVDQEAGIARVPIDRAIALVAESGLPVGSVAAEEAAATAEPSTDLANVNFQDHVLPIFEQHCAECHGEDDPEEGLQLTTYKGVMAGSFYGSVIKPGDPEGSYLLELVVTGQMPKRGPDLSQAEIDTIIAWINAGAPETGAATTEATATEDTATASAAVSFQNDVLPLFVEHCSECHGDDEPEEGLVLTSYKDVMAGSVYGSVIKPGEPDGSYLVELVATGQMPKRGADLTPDQVDTIVAWIEAGAPDN
ncbi:MAG: c-type cytochrome domain-containing protein [Caldilineaceae bacterium]